MEKRFYLLLVFVLVLSLVGCQQAAATLTAAPATEVAAEEEVATEAVEEEATEVATAEAEAVTLTVWVTGEEADGGQVQAAADAYTAQNPNVIIKTEVVPWSDAHTKILAAAAAGSGPDVITGGMSWGLELGQNGGMIDLNAQYPDIAKDIQSKTMPNIWEAIVPATGEVYGVQQSVTVNMIYYRTDILEEVTGSTDTPKTWEEFTALLDELQAAGYDAPMLWRWGNTDWLGFQSILYQAGGTFYSPDCSSVTVNSPEGAQALDFMLSLYSKYNTPTDAWPDQVAFVNGDAPVMIDGNWIVPDFDLTRPEIAGKWIPAVMPAGPSGKSVTFLGGNIIGIMSYAPQASQDAAADFIHFLYTEEAVKVQAEYRASQKGIFIPPYDEFVDIIPIGDDLKAAIIETLSTAYGPPTCPGFEAGNPDVTKAIQEAIFGEADAATALENAQAALEKTLTQ
ncbi:MAG: extracellular solute-binding protein [Anaerolineae bacterium]|nr:extracellular solute-binding protein [Anaerolineae bacterium]